VSQLLKKKSTIRDRSSKKNHDYLGEDSESIAMYKKSGTA